MSKYEKLAADILRHVGGESNIVSVVHCATRLRFKLKDDKKANQKAAESLSGVLSVVRSGGQFQIVVGSHVSDVYADIMGMANISPGEASEQPKTTVLNTVFDVISRSFSPLLGALAGAGLLKATLTVLVLTKVLAPDSSTYAVLSAAANAVFYFLPIFLGITISTKLGANPYVGGTIGAALLEPTFSRLIQAGNPVDFLGAPLVLIDYSSTVFPIFIAIAIYALFEKNLKKVIHKDLQFFIIPMLSIAVIVPLTLLIFGPFGVNVGNVIGAGIIFLSAKSGILTGAVMGAIWTFLTVFGLHWGLVPIIINNLSHGGDPLAAMLSGAVFAQLGVALAIFIKSKDKTEKALAGSTFITGSLSGVTEPIIYGFLTRYKRTLIYVPIAGAVGGAINGFLGTKSIAFAFPSFLAIPSFSPMGYYVVGVLTSFFLAIGMVMVLGYEDKQTAGEKAAQETPEVPAVTVKRERISSPMVGAVRSLKDVDDEVFSSGVMGKGIAIHPTVGKVFSPVNGVVSVVFPTSHAIGLASDNGVEMLIHVGINTVQLDGQYFTSKVEQGKKIKQGDLLLEFDIEKIEKAGFQVTTPIIITNSDNYTEIIGTDGVSVQVNEELLTLLG